MKLRVLIDPVGYRIRHISVYLQAVTMYERGLEKLDHALDLPVELPGSTQADLEQVRKNRIKMLRTRQEIVFRIRELSTQDCSSRSCDPPATVTQWVVFEFGGHLLAIPCL